MATQSSKRSGSALDSIDPRSPKRPELVEDTSVSQQVETVSLEFLPDSHLPPRQELERLNRIIHHEIQKSVKEIRRNIVPLILYILDIHCDFLDPQPRWLKDVQELHAGELVSMAQEAYNRRDYSRLMLLKGFQRPQQAVAELSSMPPISLQAIVGGWNTPFIGTAHMTLARNIREMYQKVHRESTDRKYMTHASMVQSSGSGKSRLIDMVSETIFTIPFNVRDPGARDAASRSWPPADDGIRSLLVDLTKGSQEASLHARYLYFFQAVFEETRKEVEQHAGNRAKAWHEHLEENNGEKRNALYTRVADSEAIHHALDLDSDFGDWEQYSKILQKAKDALNLLLSAVCPNATPCPGHLAKSTTTTVEDIHILIYFDEAHVLATRRVPKSSNSKTALDVLFTVLDSFREHGVFTVFISTRLHPECATPPGSVGPSARRRVVASALHAPITETPFDCFGARPIVPSCLRAEDVCDVAFMACFGRPMWRSLLLPFCDEVLAKATVTASATQTPSPGLSASEEDRDSRCGGLIDWARSKLLCETDIHAPREVYTLAAQTAVLDVRVMLPYEPGSSRAEAYQMELVERHMRTVYSVPQHRNYARSGYSSEPILAEAAARQLNHWRALDVEKTTAGGDEVEPAVRILAQDVDGGLLDRDRGEIGEAVGRLLLVLARDRAAVKAFPQIKDKDEDRIFSRAVPVNEFIEALFPPAVAQRVLDGRPDNLAPENENEDEGEGEESRPGTLREAFKDAVLNFTHFARWEGADGAAIVPSGCAAVGCFVRSMAVMCGKNAAPRVDAFIPVLFDVGAPLAPEHMTGILVQFKRRETKGAARVAYVVHEKDVGLFSSTPAVYGRQVPLPYITLVMELDLGVGEVSVSDPVHIGQSPERASKRLRLPEDQDGLEHPRYSIAAYGCSHSVYGVIKECDEDVYKSILCAGGALKEHPRQDEASLDLVRRQKPAFSTEDVSWDWIAKEDAQ
ncbi:hypothetical protein GSI_09915 [Ganoderma sinense ZZ0214-1]|uniref:Uncharacterized protein n=1 Tax=Ganoderma sinense ZZ0214-1 TaxID=1077348 RepID=A0A2G8S2I7_9APHY|nr:hypothetical protein GSI_09915 [Ganoderma sinense ZZ0214-1]